jgi:hypothetical protein
VTGVQTCALPIYKGEIDVNEYTVVEVILEWNSISFSKCSEAIAHDFCYVRM